MTRTRLAVLIVACAIAGLGGCGVGSEETARAIDPQRSPFSASGSALPTTASAGAVVERLYLVKDGMLVPVDRRVTVYPTIDNIVHDLLAGPTKAEGADGITSSLLGTTVITGVSVSNNVASVELQAALDDTGRTDEILALAQIVCTLTARSDISGVYFTQDGQRVGAPRGDGVLSQGPLTIADYVNLVKGV